MKKIIVAVLAAVMLFSATACGGMGRGTGGGSLPDSFTDDGKLIIQMFGIDLDSLQSQTEDTKKIMDVIENKFNVKFTFLSGTTSSWENLLGQYIGGGDVPDIFFHTKQEPAYSTWLKDGYLFNYSEYLDDYPNLKAAFARYDEDSLKLSLGGDYYSYPIVMDSTTDREVINEHALFYRSDWYEALKAKNWQPSSGRKLTDPEDPGFNYLNFYDLCEGFTLGDPDGNGKNDTYGYALNKDVYWMYPLFAMFGVNYNGWYKDGDKWKPEAVSDATKEAVMFVADMFDKGFINSDYASTSQQAMKNDFCNALAGMMTYNATYPMGKGVLDLMEKYIPEGKSLSDVVRAMPVVTGKDGGKYMVGYSNFYGYNAINNDVSENKKKTILSIMDWMLSEEGMQLLNYGIENVHYKMNGGEMESLLGIGTDGYPKTLYDDTVAAGIYRIKGLVSWSTLIPEHINHYEEQMQLLKSWGASDYLVQDELAYMAVSSDFALTIATLTDSVDLAYQNIINKISGDKTAEREKIWNNFVKTYTMKGDAYITAMNEQAKAVGK